MPISGSQYSTGELASLKFDKEAKDHFKIKLMISDKEVEVKNQFPPKITSDSKQAKWDEIHAKGYEEIAKWFGSYARKIGIELNYVVWGNGWGVNEIAEQVRNIKQHMYVFGTKAAFGDRLPVVKISGWKIAEATEGVPLFRLMNVGIEYSKEYVGTGNDLWPLHTKINLECKLVTGIGSIAEKRSYQEKNVSGVTLPDFPPIGWM